MKTVIWREKERERERKKEMMKVTWREEDYKIKQLVQ